MSDFTFLTNLFEQCATLYNEPSTLAVIVGVTIVSNQSDGVAIMGGGQLLFTPASHTTVKTQSGIVAITHTFPPSLVGGASYSTIGVSNATGRSISLSVVMGRPTNGLPNPVFPALSAPVSVGITLYEADDTTVASQFSFSAEAEADVLYGLGNPFGPGATNALFAISLYNPIRQAEV